MNTELKRIRFITVVVACIVCILSYIVVFQPMKDELNENKQQKFIHSAEAVWYAAEIFVKNCMDDARSLSSRTTLKQRIIEYKDGSITLQALKEYTKQNYKDGYEALKNVSGSARIVDGSIITQQGVADYINVDTDIFYTEITPIINPHSQFLTIYSPIKDGGEIFGYDIVFFSMAEMLNGIHQGHMLHELYTDRDVQRVLSTNEWTEINEDEYLITGSTDTWYIKKCESIDAYFAASSRNEVIYGALDKRIGNILFYFPLAILLIILIINFFTFKSLGKVIMGLEKAKDKYKRNALNDCLTNTFSRDYFDEYVKKHQRHLFKQPLAVAMVDVDNFKSINDTYGHLMGDSVLKEIAAVLKSSVRKWDVVIRYGGDEFLLLFRDCNLKKSQEILRRAAKEIMNIKRFDFGIDMSYGVAEVKNKEELLSAIQRADSNMYKMKNSRL